MKFIKMSVGAMALGLLAACGGGGGGGGAPVVSGGVVKGPVMGSTVCAFALSGGVKGAQLTLASAGGSGAISGGCYTTGADGKYAFTLPTGTTGDVFIEATGGKFCTTEVEMVGGACPSGTVVDLGTGKLTAVTTANAAAAVYATPLTTAAVNNATTAGTLTAAAFDGEFKTLATAVLGTGTSVTPSTVPSATNQPYLLSAAQTLASGGTLSTVVTQLQQGQGGGASTVTDTAGTVNPALVGSRTLVFQEGTKVCGSLCNYTPGQTYTFIIGSDNTLKLPGGTTLSNPVVRSYGNFQNLHEIIWKDTTAGTEYALSDNAEGGTFSEINVFDASLPSSNEGFIGQMKRPEPPAGTALSAIAGTYGLKYQYAGADVAWTTVTVATDGAISFTGGAGPDIASAQVGTVTSSINCCNRIDVLANVSINGVAGVDNDDKISLFLDAGGALKDIEYYVGGSNSIANLRGASVSATPVAIGSPGEGSWAIPAGNAISATVDGTPLTLAVTESGFNGNTSYFRIRAEELSGQTLQKMLMITVDNSSVALLENTNYSCVHGTRQKVIDLQTGPSFTQARATTSGGNCNIYITRLVVSGGVIHAIEGRFTATVYGFKRDTAQPLIADGAFKFERP